MRSGCAFHFDAGPDPSFFIADPEPVCYPDAVVDPKKDSGSQNDADSEPDADPDAQHYLKGAVRPVRSSWEGYHWISPDWYRTSTAIDFKISNPFL